MPSVQPVIPVCALDGRIKAAIFADIHLVTDISKVPAGEWIPF